MNVSDIAAAAPVIPVLTVSRIEHAAPLAQALVAGGLPVIEVTLRNPVALDVIRAMRVAAPEAIVGAGTLRTAEDVYAARESGAVFGVSPGATPTLLDSVGDWPFLPGCATASEAMALAERGFSLLKFFPAGPAGGPAFLKALAAPLPDIRFCPTGGVSAANAADYLRLDNVAVVGGSWVAPSDAIRNGEWSTVTSLAQEAAALRQV